MTESPFVPSPAEIPTAIARQVDYGERVLWTGKPDARRLTLKGIAVALLAALLLPVVFPWNESSILCLMIMAGILTKAFQFWWKASIAHNTFYALTERRALIVVEGKEVERIGAKEFLIKHRNFAHRGDVVLTLETTEDNYTEVGFFSIENSHEVARLAHELKEKASSPAPESHPLQVA